VSRLTIAHVTSELAPLAKLGGLGDVAGALSQEQARRGHRVTAVMPGYGARGCPADWRRETLGACDVPWAMGKEPARFELLHEPGGDRRVVLVHHDGERRFFDRPGIYNEPTTGEAYPDNAERFLFFNRAALEALKRLDGPVDILHAHDHQTAWAPCFVRTHDAQHPVFRGTATVFTIHNLGYQGLYDPWVLALAGFPLTQFFPGSPFEYWGRVNFMKVGLSFADMISTVSPRYAREIQSSGEFGFGLEGLLARRERDLRGILNGIDDREWGPATDPHLPARYDAENLDGKRACRAELARRCGFSDGHRAIVGMVSRLVEQKGFDLIEEAAADLLALNARFIVLGFGQPRYQELLKRLAKEHPDRFCHRAEQNEAFAHLVEAGSDLFLMPSRYEPCGLNQMYSLRYGTPPVVRETGGLADTVQEFDVLTKQGTGFLFEEYEAPAMVAALKRALAIRKQPELWAALIRNGMRQDFSWRASVDGYDRLYEEARERVNGGRVVTLETARTRV
jgi:starch synthase